MMEKQSKKELFVLGAKFGKPIPSVEDIEEAIISAILVEPKSFEKIAHLISPESFFKKDHKVIVQAFFTIHKSGNSIDLLSLKNHLENIGLIQKAGGIANIVSISSKVSTASHILWHVKILNQAYLKRELIEISNKFAWAAFDNSQDSFKLLEEFETEIFEVGNKSMTKSLRTMKELISDVKDKVKEASKSPGGVLGVKSGFPELDVLTSGFKGSELIVLAARPAMGKTAMVLNMATNMVIEHNLPVAIFSLEMNAVQMVLRIIANESGVSADKIKKGNLTKEEWERLENKTKMLSEVPLIIDDTPGLSVYQLRAKAQRLKEKNKIGAIIIDYLQLMSASESNPPNRQEEVAIISRYLKLIAKELDIPIFALSQLSRNIANRSKDKYRPLLSDLRESGAIEQDADMVMFIHRPEYYGLTQDENGNDQHGLTELIIAKHRNGGLKDIKLRFEGEYGRFIPWHNQGNIDPYNSIVKSSCF